MKSLTLFNHKGGVGKTTLTVNLANAFANLGLRVLIVDADPQCNLSAYYLEEDELDGILGESANEETSNTIWSAIKPVVLGRGGISVPATKKINDNLYLVVGDVLLSQYEEELPIAWLESFARKPRGYDVFCSLEKAAKSAATAIDAQIIMYDVGPNVGALNRTILLGSDYFITPVHTDLFSLRALTTVGQSLSRWITDWRTITMLAGEADRESLLRGEPQYLGYVSTAYKVYAEQKKAKSHEYWESLLPERVENRVLKPLRSLNSNLIVGDNAKLGEIQNFHSLAALAQEHGVPVGNLRGIADFSQYKKIDLLNDQFKKLAEQISKLIGVVN